MDDKLKRKEVTQGLKTSKYNTHLKINGPVSLHYCISSNNKFTCLLFGDTHGSKKNMCNKSGTTLYSKTLLKQLNKLSSDKKNVNIYLEYWEESLQENDITIGSHIDHMNDCIFNAYKNAYKYPNIKFIGADIRRSTNGVTSFIHKLYEYTKGDLMKDGFNIPFTKKWNVKSLSKWISHGFSQHNSIKVLLKTFLKLSLKYEETEKDFLFKVIARQKVAERRKISFWINLISEKHELQFDFLNNNHDFSVILETLNSVFDKTNKVVKPINTFYLKQLNRFFLLFGCILMDIYTIALMFNNLSKSKVTLSIFYFGDYHIFDIKMILICLGYKFTASIDVKSCENGFPNRCLDVSNILINL